MVWILLLQNSVEIFIMAEDLRAFIMAKVLESFYAIRDITNVPLKVPGSRQGLCCFSELAMLWKEL